MEEDEFAQFGGYAIDSPVEEEDEFAQFGGYAIDPPISKTPQEDKWLPLIGKSLVKGVAGLGDLASKAVTAFQDPNMINSDDLYNEKNYTLSLPTLSQEGLDYLDLQPNPGENSFKNIAGLGAEFAASAGPLGAIGKGASLINRFKGIKDAAMLGANAGVLSGGLQEAGINPLVADIVGAASPTPAALSRGIGSAKRSLMGLSPSKIKLDTAKAFNDLGIDLTAPILSESKAPGLAESILGKAPITGSKIAEKYKKIDEQVKNSLEDTLDKLSPRRTEALEESINQDYTKIGKLLSKEDKIIPHNLLETLDSIDIKSASNSPAEKAVLKVIDDYKKAFDIKHNKSIKKLFPGEVPNIAPEPASVKELWKAKKSLNSMIKDKDFGDVRNLLKSIRAGVHKDLEEFGKLNPEWGNLYKQTDLTYSKLKGRDTLQDLLIDDPTNFGSGTFSYNQLAKNIKSPEKARKIQLAIKNDPELSERIDKLGIVASSYANKVARNPNPSGTAGTDQVMKYLLSSTGLGISYASPVTGVATGAMSLLITRGLTNKKFLDSAISYAEKPNITNRMRFGKAIKQATGLSPVVLARELERDTND